MLSVHRVRGTFRRDVDVYIALTEFARRLSRVEKNVRAL